MWETRDPRTSRSVAGARLGHIDIGTSRLSHWPPPHRDSDEKLPPIVAQQEHAAEAPAKRPIRRGWHLKAPVT